jgi:hypothetical protein
MGLRQTVTAKHIRGPDRRPEPRQGPGHPGEVVATGGQSRTIDGARGGAPDNRKRIALRLNPFDLTYAFENAGLIGAAGAPARHHQTESVFHGLSMRHPERF